jgi:alanyl-tRNA synthetase
MRTDQIVSTFIGFFRERGHERVTEGSLVPPPGDSVLFTTSGMHPLTPYLEGRPHPLGRRLTNVQRCLRTTDLDEVGDDTHLTVFEMLGSWSLGDYGGSQSLQWGYELLRDGFGVDPDTESLETWRELGVPVELTREDNWWSNGPTGPCGPDSEIFAWTGDIPPQGNPGSDERWVEVWNHVMMRYHRHSDGSLEPLLQPNVDTGLGLERLVAVLQGKRSVYEIDVFDPWMETVPDLWRPSEYSLRVICDHLRSGIVIVGDGIEPSTAGRGYVLRRLTRRVLTTLWREDSTRTLTDLPQDLIEHTLDHFQQSCGVEYVRGVLLDEEQRFGKLLERGRQLLSRPRFSGPLSEEDYEYLHETHGLPRELIELVRPSR